MHNFLDAIREHARKTPDKAALIFEDQSISYAELDRASNAVASLLIRRGLLPDTMVPVLFPRGIEALIAAIGVLKTGSAFVIVNADDPGERIDFQLKDIGGFPPVDKAFLSVCLDDDSDTLPPDIRPLPEDPALVVYTSGSTGNPKGVVNSWQALNLALESMILGRSEKDIFLSTMSHSFIGITADSLVALYLGATLHIASDKIRRDADALLEYSRKHAITTAILAPQLLSEVLDRGQVPMRILLTGSERVSEIYSDSIKLYCLYGASETCGPFTSFLIDKAYPTTPCGLPSPGSAIYILDEEGHSLPAGETGEICVSGQIASCYLNLPELSREKFIPNPFSEGHGDDRLFRTGDLGYLREDGVLEYVNRKDWMLKIRGFRVEPGEIEAAIVRLTPARQAVVTAYKNASGQESLYAVYTADQDLPARKVEEAIRGFLPDYMMPALMEQVESLPLNPNGKIDRKSITAPDIERFKADYQAPTNAEEERLCMAFVKVLGLDRVGILDDFVLLGGDSISAVRLQSILPDLELGLLFSLRTPKALASHLSEKEELLPAADRPYWPLTDAESQMVAEYALHPGTLAYNIEDTLLLKGKIDADRWEDALKGLVARHRILRSSYPVYEGEYRHVIHDEVPVKLLCLECTPEEVEDRINELNRPYDLETGPLFRFSLLVTGPGSGVLLLAFHHIVLDGSCAGILIKDLEDLYNGKALPAPGPDLFDWAVWRKEHPRGPEAETFFMDMFRDGLPEYDMPTRPIRPDILPVPDRTVEWTMAAKAIDDTARHYGVTAYTLMMAVIGMVLSKYTASEDVVVGAAMSGRAESNSRSIVGMFANTVALRLKAPGTCEFAEYLAEVAALLNEVKYHQDYPLHELVRVLELDRVPSRNPVYDILVNYISRLPVLDLDDLEAVYRHRANQRLPIDLQLEIFREGDSLSFQLSYSEALYLPEIPENFADQLRISLERVCAGCKLSLVEALELPEEQSRRLLEDFSGLENNEGKGLTVVDQFRDRVRLLPDHPSVRSKDTLLNYKDLDDLTDRLACELSRRGVGRGDCVGILVGRNEMMPVGGLGVLKSGAAYLPLDPSYPADRLEFMLQDAGVRLLVADESLCELIPGFEGEFLFTNEIAGLPSGKLPEGPREEDLFVILYTSGTTGKPKGVCIHHENMTHFCAWYRRYYELEDTDSVAAYASFGFDACLMDLYPALTAGAMIHIIPEEMRLDVEAIDRYFEDSGVTLVFMTTQLGRQFAETMEGNSLRHLSTGGETLVPIDPPSRYGFHNLYGPTEGTIISTAFPVDRLYDRVPIGKPVDNTRIYILDRHNRLAPIGVPGELCIAGRGVARGYLGRPELTQEKFISNPFTTEEDYKRLYRTGDVVRYLPDGNLDFVGRNDFQVKIRGFRVELPEIEGRIRAFPGIKDASVLPMDAPGGGKCAVAYVVIEGTLDVSELNRFIEEKLPPYMVPAATIQVDRIPLNPNGKVDRKKLPAPGFAETALAEPAAFVQTDLGKEIAQVIEEVLGHSQFSASSNLLQAGLASLGAIKLSSLLKKRFGVAPSVQEVLANPTPLFIENRIVRGLLDKEIEKQESFIGARDDSSSDIGYPLSGSQMGVYLDCQKDSQALSYNIPTRLVLPTSIDAKQLTAAITTVLESHPGIHVRIEESSEGIRQVPLEEAVRVDRLSLTEEEAESFAKSFVEPFELTKGPLYRVAVVESPLALLVFSDFHHIIFDGASMDLFLQEVGQVYEGGIPLTEEMAGHTYGNWEAQEEAGDAWEQHRTYFAGLLRDIEAASELAPDLPGKKEGRLLKAECPVDRQAAEAFCSKHGLTLAGLFLAATSYCLGRWTGGPSVSLSTISSGRSDSRILNSYGMFVRTLPLVISMDQDQSVLDYIRRAQAALHASISHEAYPYTLIAQEHGFQPNIMYTYELGVLSDYRIAGQSFRIEELSTQAPKFKISIHVEERGPDTVFSVQYNDALYSHSRMEGLAESLAFSFSQMLNSPDGKVRGVSLLSEKEADLIRSFQPANPPPLPCPLLHGMFEEAADRSPDSTALIACEGQYSYGQLDAEANRIANALIKLGLASEERVAFLLPRTGRILMTMLGILKAGGAYVPLDLEYPKGRVEQILADSQARFLITNEDWLADYPQALNIDELRTHPDDRRPDRTVQPDQLAYIIYTSGSTGKPKGVMIEHYGIANYLTPAPENIHIHALVEDASCMMSITTVTFDMFLKESMAALCNGLKLVFADADAARDPIRLAALFEETGADAFNATPSRMMEYISYPALLAAIRRCRVVMAGAEKYPAKLMEQLRGGEGRKARLFNTYGPTEITVSSNGKELTSADRVTIGGPLLGVVESVMDPDGNELPTGIVGELWIGGRGVARGYVNLPEQTKERFVIHKGIRMYRSGDMARWTDDGEIELLGRNDKQIKLRGLRIELGEVEAVLLAIPGIKNAAVIIKEVQGSDRLCAYYTAQQEIAPGHLQEEMSKHLSPYMVPTAWLQIPAFPQTSTGKIDYKKLPDPSPHRLQEYTAPATATEEKLAAVFAEVLDLDPDEVGAEDSFFDIGGSSLSVTRVVIALKESGLETADRKAVSFGDVFANPTPRALGSLLARGEIRKSVFGSADDYDYREIDRALAENTLEAFRRGSSRELGHVLLTGATGFLGIHVLRELIRDPGTEKIFCLMRRGRHGKPHDRLKNHLFYYFEDSYADLFGDRIVPIEGDITEPDSLARLKDSGLDTVINCAANVTHFAKDDSIFRINTAGVDNLIDFCLDTGARLIQISTASVAGFSVDGKPLPGEKFTEQRLYMGQNLENQYVYSKFLSERNLLAASASRGLDAKIMRVGNLMARDSDGEFQMNAAANSFLGRLRAYSVVGSFPYSAYLAPAGMAPIDSTAEAVVLLAKTPSLCRIFQPFNDHSIFQGDIVAIMREEGIPINLLEDAAYEKALENSLKDAGRAEYLTSLVAYQGMAGGKSLAPVAVDNQFTSQVLLRMNWRWPVTDNDYLRKFLRDLISLGFFEKPNLLKSK